MWPQYVAILLLFEMKKSPNVFVLHIALSSPDPEGDQHQTYQPEVFTLEFGHFVDLFIFFVLFLDDVRNEF